MSNSVKFSQNLNIYPISSTFLVSKLLTFKYVNPLQYFAGMFSGCSILKTTIVIDVSSIDSTPGYAYNQMLLGAATADGAQITIRYKASQKGIIDKMVETKSANSNIVLEVVAE